MLFRSEDWAQQLGQWGIGPDTTVVAYDDQGGCYAARAWWMLRWVGHSRVAVLDGGKSYGPPRRNHVATLRTGKPVQDTQLVTELAGLEYPLHFIDFEASRIPVPYLPGMKPYEQVAFQFSCHTLASPDATELQHVQWLNLNDVYPNDEFVCEIGRAHV